MDNMFNISNSLTEHLVYIGGTTIVPANIMDLTLERSIDSMASYGTITFKDVTNIYSTLPINEETSIQLYLTDQESVNFNNSEYKILDIQEIRTGPNSETIVTIDFVDLIYFNASKAYVSNGFTETTLADVVKKLLSEDYVDIGLYKLEVSDAESITYPQLVTPKNRNVLQVIKKLSTDEGFLVYRTKLAFNVKKMKELVAEPVIDEAKFKETTLKRERKRIIEKSSKTNSQLDNLLYTIDTDMFSYNIETKSVTPIPITNEEIYKDYTLESKISFIKNEIEGINKYSWKHTEFLNDRIKLDYGNSMMNKVTLELTVNGSFLVDVGSVVEVTIGNSDANNLLEEQKEVSGKYIVQKVLDKIVTGYYVQKLFLMRADQKS